MSLTDVTIRAAIMVGLATFALVASGWRKTARAQTKLRRAPEGTVGGSKVPLQPKRVPIEVTQAPAEAYHRPGPLRRAWAVVAGAGLVVVMGAIVATLVAFGVAISITVLTNMLRQ